MYRNTQETFGIVSRIFHWLMSFTIICLLIVGFVMTDMEAPGKYMLYAPHKAIGVLVLGFAFLRLIWRLANISPNLPSTMPSWQRFGYRFGVFFMYIFMFAMPISGLIMSLNFGFDVHVFNLFTIKSAGKNIELAKMAADIHSFCAIAFVFLISAHTAIALYHHFIDKDRLLMRMVKGK